MKFHSFPLSEVKLTDTFCLNARGKEVAYLLAIDARRLLAGFYKNAGLALPASRYGGWEDKLIGGHTLGHYLSALSQACVGAVAEQQEQLKARLGEILGGLELCQARSGGFLWGAPRTKEGAEGQFDCVEHGRTNIKREAWVPWYTMHKLLCGLIDAYAIAGEARALAIAEKLGGWVVARTARWDARTQKTVLKTEYGGMNDCLYDLYFYTGKEEFALAAHRFDEERLFDAILTEGKDVLKDLHANTTIPKVLGALKRYLVLHGKEIGGERVDATRYLAVAKAFFRMVTERHTYVTGGSSEWEHFGSDFILDAERTNCNCETCVSGNMMKLARLLFLVTGEAVYADYYDETFTNAILGSQDPETGMTMYFQPMASGFFKVFSHPFDDFWCCTGSGMENFTRLQEGIFYTRDGDVYLERYLSAELTNEEVSLSVTCDFPFSQIGKVRVTRAKHPFHLYFRIPDWSEGGINVGKNGIRLILEETNGHVCVEAKEGDEFLFAIPVTVTLKGLPDGGALAVRWGGALLAAVLGEEGGEETETGVGVRIPALARGSDVVCFDDLADFFETPSSYFVREGEGLRLKGGSVPLTFKLYSRICKERYAIYLHFCEYLQKDGVKSIPPVRRERLPFDKVEAGYGQYETDELHAMEEKKTEAFTDCGTGRRAKAGGWFSYDFAVKEGTSLTLSICLRRADNGKTLQIEAGHKVVFAERLLYTMGEETYRREIDLTPLLPMAKTKTVNGKEVRFLTVKFSGIGRRASAYVCDFIELYAD